MMAHGQSGASSNNYRLKLVNLMFENLVLPPPDEILELMHEFRTDSRLQKIDLGVGVYKNNLGNTSALRGYYAEVVMSNDEETQCELYTVGSEVFESSK